MGRHSEAPVESSSDKATLGRRIRDARRALGLTQEALGRPDFTKGFISLLENDRAKPSVASLARLAVRLGRPVSYFLDVDDAELSAKRLDALRSRGRAELARRSFVQALATFEELRRAASSLHDAVEPDAALGMGEALLGLERFDDARAELETARDAAERAGAGWAGCRAVYGLAEIELRNGRYPEAAALSRSAADAAAALSADPALRGEIDLQLGTALSALGRSEEAAEAYRTARVMLQEAGDADAAASAQYVRGDQLSTAGRYADAMVHFERSGALFERGRTARSLSAVHDFSGALLMQLGRASDAAEHFGASLALKERLHDVRGECHVLTELARCLNACGEAVRAKALVERAAARSREARLRDEEARAQAVLGTLAAAAGDLREALRALVAAARYCEGAGLTVELVPIYQELARVAGLAGRYKEASTYHERAFRLLETMRPGDIAAAMRSTDPASSREHGANQPPHAPDH
jgi:tetratricopeptide (TPR) repeat protein